LLRFCLPGPSRCSRPWCAPTRCRPRDWPAGAKARSLVMAARLADWRVPANLACVRRSGLTAVPAATTASHAYPVRRPTLARPREQATTARSRDRRAPARRPNARGSSRMTAARAPTTASHASRVGRPTLARPKPRVTPERRGIGGHLQDDPMHAGLLERRRHEQLRLPRMRPEWALGRFLHHRQTPGCPPGRPVGHGRSILPAPFGRPSPTQTLKCRRPGRPACKTWRGSRPCDGCRLPCLYPSTLQSMTVATSTSSGFDQAPVEAQRTRTPPSLPAIFRLHFAVKRLSTSRGLPSGGSLL
jgi:hypothetical protein